ncbi:MAG: aminopeptidase [Cyclobacteriaceae bacterium]|nr:MAG: aminopeptidase [Cyclobacteriaceae bacterium]
MRLLVSMVIILSAVGCGNSNQHSGLPTSTNIENLMTTPVKDIHSNAEPGQAIMQHLKWNAEIDFDSMRILGKASIRISRDPKADILILDTKNLLIDSVKAGSETRETPVDFSLGKFDEILGSALEIDLPPDADWVHVYYQTGDGAEALQWLSPQQTAGKQHPFLFTQSQAILARTWIPLQDSPGIRFTYEASVKVPPELLVLMSAENPQQKNQQGIYQFKMEQPIPAYLMALAAGNITFQSLGSRSGVYAEPELIDSAAYEFAELEEMISIAEGLYGPYRWNRYDIIVLPPSFPFGGMENPMLTFATPTILAGDRSLTSLVAHELAHSWSGNLVTNATWEDFWLNEGFTVYFENRIMEALYDSEYSEMLALLSLQDLKAEVDEMTKNKQAGDTHLKLDLKNRNPDDGVTTIAYEKGYFFLRWLEERSGRALWDKFLIRYFDENAFQSMTTEHFLYYLKKNLIEKQHLNIYQDELDEWVYHSGLPESLPVPRSGKFERVDMDLDIWLNTGTFPSTDQWSTHEWLHFIRGLPNDLDHAAVISLDETFDLTGSGNAEILAAWFEKAIVYDYKPAYPAIAEFLKKVGRRKFLSPLYRALANTPEGKEFATEVYEEARPNYHFVSVNSIDEILDYE